METSWWLSWSCLPEQLHWARLQVAKDGSAVVLDLDGKYHHFPNLQEARFWLNEDEYSQLAHLIESGQVEADVSPPVSDSNRKLLTLMLVRRVIGKQGGNDQPADARRSPVAS